MRATRWLSAVVAMLGLLAATGARAEAPPLERSDAARSYLTFERTFAAYPPGDDRRTQIARRFDYLTHLTFRGYWERAVIEFDRLTDALLPPAQVTPAQRAARATRVWTQTPVIVRGEADRAVVSLGPAYHVPGRPEQLTVRLRHADADELVLQQAFATAGDSIEWTYGDAPAGQYVVEVVPSAGPAWVRGEITLVDRRPSELRKELRERLATVRETLPADRLDLRRSLAAAEARLALLRDVPDAEASASFLADVAQLSQHLPAEVSALERGEDPYANRAGDYWRTFTSLAGPALTFPARVYAPPSALTAEAQGRTVPLVIALHGAGGDENLFMDGYGAGMLKTLADLHGFVLVSPLTYPAMTDPRVLPAIVESLGQLYAIDSTRVYALGHSLGAITAASWGWRFTDTLAGVALIAGGGQPAMVEQGVPTFVAAAGHDYIFNASRLRGLTEAVAKAGEPVRFVLFEAEGHVSVVPEALPGAIDWLLQQHRDVPEAPQDQ